MEGGGDFSGPVEPSTILIVFVFVVGLTLSCCTLGSVEPFDSGLFLFRGFLLVDPFRVR